MKYSGILFSCVLLFVTAGCGHVDLTPEGDPNRVLTGTVNVRMNLIPPPDAEVVVRILNPSDVTAAPTAPSKDLVIGERGTREQPEQVVAEQTIHAPPAMPVSFRIEYRASDAMLRRGLNIDARISWGGRIRFRTVDAQAVTLATVESPHVIWVEPVQ
jgi:uncharacterized lipoprotein YbaY